METGKKKGGRLDGLLDLFSAVTFLCRVIPEYELVLPVFCIRLTEGGQRCKQEPNQYDFQKSLYGVEEVALPVFC